MEPLNTHMPIWLVAWTSVKVARCAGLAIVLLFSILAQAQEPSYRVVAITFGSATSSETAQPMLKSSFAVSGAPGRPYGWGFIIRTSARQVLKLQEELVFPSPPSQWYQGESLGFKIGSDGVTAIREFEVPVEAGDNWVFAVRYPQVGDPRGPHTSSISLSGRNIARRKFLVE